MTAPKSNPSQRGRRSEAKVPMFTVVADHKSPVTGGKTWDFVTHWDVNDGIEAVELTAEQYNDLNREALEQSLQHALKDPERRDQITDKLKSEEWGEVARFAAYGQQIEALDLKPWQSPPSALECDVAKFDAILAKPDPIGDYATVRLTRMMIKLGVSVYVPDPIAEIKKVLKHTRRGRPPR
jgi:hypothetical protein